MTHTLIVIWLCGMVFNTILATYGMVVRCEKAQMPLKWMLNAYRIEPLFILVEFVAIVAWPLFYAFMAYKAYTSSVFDYYDHS